MKPVTPLDIFEWAVVRQSALGPGIEQCAFAHSISTDDVRRLIGEWNDPRGEMSIGRVNLLNERIDAYYNTSGDAS